MITITREEFKRDKWFKKLYEHILKCHVVPEHTGKALLENKHIKDFCVMSMHFVLLEGKPPIFLHYEVSSWYVTEGARIRIDRIVLYDNFMEYETARTKALYTGPTGGKDVVLLCYEEPTKFCHRHQVAHWFQEAGIDVKEYGLKPKAQTTMFE